MEQRRLRAEAAARQAEGKLIEPTPVQAEN
jgi:hypothetical protein